MKLSSFSRFLPNVFQNEFLTACFANIKQNAAWYLFLFFFVVFFVGFRFNLAESEKNKKMKKQKKTNLKYKRFQHYSHNPAYNNQVPRLIAWYTDYPCHCKYMYNNIECYPTPTPDWLVVLREMLCKILCNVRGFAKHFREKGYPNSCNINLYRDGNDCVGWHADDENLFGAIHTQKSTIISFSLGASRLFEIRSKNVNTLVFVCVCVCVCVCVFLFVCVFAFVFLNVFQTRSTKTKMCQKKKTK